MYKVIVLCILAKNSRGQNYSKRGGIPPPSPPQMKPCLMYYHHAVLLIYYFVVTRALKYDSSH